MPKFESEFASHMDKMTTWGNLIFLLQCPSRTCRDIKVQLEPDIEEPERLIAIEGSKILESDELESVLSQFFTSLDDCAKYKHLLVMPLSGRNLHDVIDKEWASHDLYTTIVALIKAVSDLLQTHTVLSILFLPATLQS